MLTDSVHKTRALGLISGGLDSALAAKLLLDQGIQVTAVNFTSPFCLCTSGGKCHAAEAARDLDIPIMIVPKGRDYLKVIKRPRHGYGSGMNPCVDCRIYTLRKAKTLAKRVGAKFIFTGEVLGQRPTSQHLSALRVIEREAGLENKVLRPLSAQLLPETEAEEKGWVDRGKLMAIRGRGRRTQISLASEAGMEYPCPSGGCLLTQKEFARKVKDLFENKKRISTNDILLLKIGRHFRVGKNKIVVGRNKLENDRLSQLKSRYDYMFTVLGCGSPTTVLQGPKVKKIVRTAASLTACYSDAEAGSVLVSYGRDAFEKSIVVRPISKKRAADLRI